MSEDNRGHVTDNRAYCMFTAMTKCTLLDAYSLHHLFFVTWKILCAIFSLTYAFNANTYKLGSVFPQWTGKASASLQLKNYQGSSSSLLLQLANAARFLRWKAKWKWEQVHTVKLISREKKFGNCFRVSHCKCASVKCVTVEWRFHCQMSTSAPPRRVLLANELHSISQRHKQYTHILTWSKALKNAFKSAKLHFF